MGNIFDCAQNPLNVPPEDGSAIGDAASSGKPFTIQGPTRLMDSVVWGLQQAFYEKMGVTAWAEGIVPNFVTSNSFIARAYAKVILGFLNDVYDAPPGSPFKADPSQPVYIVEIGAGHGKFGYLVIEALLRLREFLPQADSDHTRTMLPREGDGADPALDDEEVELRNLPFKYIMTDFTLRNVEFWREHPSLKPLVDLGILDFAVFNAETDSALHLFHANTVIDASTTKNPMVFISNYIFDTLAADAYRVVSGELQRGFVSLTSAKEEPDLHDPDIIKRMVPQWTYAAVKPDEDFLGDPAFNELISYYAARFQNASFLIPVGGLAMSRSLLRISNNRMLLLVGDKGYNCEEEIEGLRDPHVAVHGSFSLMVNLHSVGRYFEGLGGSALHTPGLEGLKCALFFSGGDSRMFSQTRWAFKEGVQDFGPESFSTLQRCVKEECPNPSMKHVLALLRLSNHDSDVFYKFKQVLIDKIVFPYSTELVQMDVRGDIEKVFAGYYPLQESKDVCFEIGRLLMGVKEYAGAVEFFKRSQELCGVHHVTWHNMGICFYYQDALDDAEKCFQESLALKPNYVEAHSWMGQVREKMVKSGRYPGVHGGTGLAAAHGMSGDVGTGSGEGGEYESGEEEEDEDDDEEADEHDGHDHGPHGHTH